ncbi:MAG: NAD(P)H-binding protein [Desulfovibrio sp.]|jgi:NADH dehydrogenase|nr:NAD(P)H-binding protein [Desulfovibrio sp.]
MATHAVTGAFGFTGRYIAKRLLDAGETVVTLTNSPDRPSPFRGKIAAHPFRFDDADAMAKSLAGVDILYNTYWVRFNRAGLFNHSDAVHNTKALFDAAKAAGVGRIVHVSITNADESSHLQYIRGKGHLERLLRESGMSYAVVRPAVLFGPEDILINNIAWALRRFPVFAVFGDGRYHIRPVYVDDLAELMLERGKATDNGIVDALGPEDFSFRELAVMIRDTLGLKRPIISIPTLLGYPACLAVGKLVGDVFVTRDEIEGLTAGALHVEGAAPTGKTYLSAWVKLHKETIGKHYHGEMQRRTDRQKAYESMAG